jgi:hypothetical protein
VRLVYVISAQTANPHNSQTPARADCPAGYYVTGGGVLSESSVPGEQQVNSSFPLTTGAGVISTAWKAYVDNTSPTDYSFWVYAICTLPSTVAKSGSAAVGAKR